uniref:Transposon Ty3-I Gag-Pol polyprotein n=1 Tax=Noccaea caerulescens TaxID=107243 RepID=A0A1J3KBK3_NOCCA
MKAILTSNVSLEEGAMMITKECSAILQNRMPEKLDDPGSFVLACEIGGTLFDRALCDLGSSVNLMPYSVARLLGITNFKPTKIYLVFADRSVRRPIGVVLDVTIVVRGCNIPADFVVLESEHEPKDPIILGRPFLATAGAMIDVKNGKIDLHLGDIVMNFEVNRTIDRPTMDGQTFWIGEAKEEILEDMLLHDPLELALTRAEEELGYAEREAQGLVKFMDSVEAYKELVAYTDLKRSKEEETKAEKQKPTQPEPDPWCPLRAPKTDLKPLPVGLRYEYLGPNETYHVIINSGLTNEETALLVHELRKHRRALGYSLDDITGISPNLCMHRVILEDGSSSSIEHQRRLNLNLKEVVKKEIMKLLNAGIIYPISDSKWVSPVHVVPMKGGITVVKNDQDELIPTRTITGHRMCVDYRKLNSATRKYHYPLPFIDQMLERLANHQYYCFLDGYSGFFQIPIHPDDQEKTTFTCPYGTFAYRRMPFGLCNAPATFQRCMMSIFTDFIEEIMEVFMDDFSVYGSSFKACQQILEKFYSDVKINT